MWCLDHICFSLSIPSRVRAVLSLDRNFNAISSHAFDDLTDYTALHCDWLFRDFLVSFPHA